MSNVESDPVEVQASWSECPVAGVEVITAREVPLGGPRAMVVRRTLPQRARSLIGAWCFLDHYGPEDVAVVGGMDVAPHPHTGLQTVSWLFSGEIEHRDSGGAHAMVRPGELNLMTGGRGISHSEVSTPETTVLAGVQMWLALPDTGRDAPRALDHFVPEAEAVGPGSTLRVFLGELAGQASPVATQTPLLGAELILAAGASLGLDASRDFEHGVLVDRGQVEFGGQPLARGELGYLAPGAARLDLRNEGAEPARLILIGGTPFEEDIIMWWNFVARTHDEIAEFRREWEAGGERFGRVECYAGERSRLPAPALPTTRLKPRRRPGG